MDIRKCVSPHCNDRTKGTKPVFLILHYTGTTGGTEAGNYYLASEPPNGGPPASPHYMVDRDGAVTQFVAEDKRAWHAGESYWGGETDINSLSIGIELVNLGHEGDCPPFPGAQMEVLTALCKDILNRHDIPPHRVLAHSDIAPLRRSDPGEKFDWKYLAGQGIGLYPLHPIISPGEKGFLSNLKEFLELYGYNPALDLKTMITAFQRHFQPEIFETPEQVGQANEKTAQILDWLLHRKEALAAE